MNVKSYRYIFKVQYLGFRYSGWQRQPGQRTIEGMLLKTLKFILPNTAVKLLGAGRTDAKVSAVDAAFELFIGVQLINNQDFINLFNANLPADIRIISCNAVDDLFNVIKDIHKKEYHYYFSYGSKNHPFCAPFMANFPEALDIQNMIRAAALFEGTHNFKSYTVRRKKEAGSRRNISSCLLEENTFFKGSFFPETSYVLKIEGKGFMRYQIRMIMGALIQLGKGVITYEEIETSLQDDSKMTLDYVAPGSGLILYTTQHKK